MRIVSLSGGGRLTGHGKGLVALSMYDKGIAFVEATVLVEKHGHRYVVLYQNKADREQT